MEAGRSGGRGEASRGYPETSSSGDVIVGTETLAAEDDVAAVHAGTARRDGALVPRAAGCSP